MTAELLSVILVLCAPAAGGGEECRTVIIGETSDCAVGPQLMLVKWQGMLPRERVVRWWCERIEG